MQAVMWQTQSIQLAMAKQERIGTLALAWGAISTSNCRIQLSQASLCVDGIRSSLVIVLLIQGICDVAKAFLVPYLGSHLEGPSDDSLALCHYAIAAGQQDVHSHDALESFT